MEGTPELLTQDRRVQQGSTLLIGLLLDSLQCAASTFDALKGLSGNMRLTFESEED